MNIRPARPKMHRATLAYHIVLVLFVLPGMLLGPLAQSQPALASAPAREEAPAVSQSLEPEQQPTSPGPAVLAGETSAPGIPAALLQAAGPASMAKAAAAEPLLGVCAAKQGETRCEPASPEEAEAWNAPPELVATLRGEPSPLAAALAQPSATRGVTLTVATTNMTINGDISSVSALQANSGPDGISFLEAVAAINNTAPGYGIAFAPALKGKVISYPATLFIRMDNTTIYGDVDNDAVPDILYIGPIGAISLRIYASGVTIKRMAVSGLDISGSDSHNNTIKENYIGLALDAKTSAAANTNGVQIFHGAHNNAVIYNRIAGNFMPDANKDASGVIVAFGAHHNTIAGNMIGTNDSQAASPNEIGVALLWGALQNLVGGERASTMNVCGGNCNQLSGNLRNAVLISGSDTKLNVVKGNFIGTDTNGVQAIPNAYPAIWIDGGAQGNKIGAARPQSACNGPCNLISGNSQEGIVITGMNTSWNLVSGNFIGVALDGSTPLPNQSAGVLIQGQASQNLVGGALSSLATCDGNCNLIGGNKGSGVGIVGEGTDKNEVVGNFIGVDLQKMFVPNSGYGVAIVDASNNAVGISNLYPATNQGNYIGSNLEGGVLVYKRPVQHATASASGNTVRMNRFNSNQGLNIDLAPVQGFGVDKTSGPNGGQAPPVLARSAPGSEIWTGKVSAPDDSVVDLYSEGGAVYLGSAVVQNGEFSKDLSSVSNLHPPVFATVTTPQGSTSEFSGMARFSLSSSNALPGQKVFAFAVITDTIMTDQVNRTTKDVQITLGAQTETLTNDGQEDLFKGDDYFSVWVTAPTAPGKYTASLLLNGVPIATAAVEVIQKPELLVLTDFTALRDEFRRTAGKTEALTIHTALTALNAYASNNKGVVLDVRAEVPRYARWKYTRPSDRVSMGSAIVAWLGKKFSRYPGLKYVAIIGDDAVIPFVREKDTVCGNVFTIYKKKIRRAYVQCEKRYAGVFLRRYRGAWRNTVLRDMARGYRLSDTQYSTGGMQTSQPVIRVGLGRVFFSTPAQLVAGLKAYQEPLDLYGSAGSAAALYLPDVSSRCGTRKPMPRGLCTSLFVTKYFVPVLKRAFPMIMPVGNEQEKPIGAQSLYLYDKRNVRWSRYSVSNALSYAELTVMVTHSSQFGMRVLRGRYFRTIDIDRLGVDPTTALFSTVGCHIGLSTARNGPPAVYYRSISRALLGKYIPFIAPMNYAWANNFYSAYAIRMEMLLLYTLLTKNTQTTMGDLFRNTQNTYKYYTHPTKHGSYDINNYMDVTTRYNYILYGLPTQVINRAPSPYLPQPDAALQPDMLAASSSLHTLNISIAPPNFEQVTLPDGSAYVSVPNNGGLSTYAHLPILPEIVQTYRLPVSSTVSSVALTGVTTHTYPVTFTPATATPVTLNGEVFPGSASLTQTFPSEVYWYTAGQVDGSTLLRVVVNPMQYDPSTGKATLYDQVNLRITYQAPDSNASLTGITLNNGSPVNAGMSSLPLRFDVSSTQAANLSLEYEVYDMAGLLVASGVTAASLGGGATAISLTTNTLGWHPGPMLLNASLLNGAAVVSTFSKGFIVQGRSLNAYTGQASYGSEITATLYAEVYDQDGAGVPALGAVFTATLDGAPLSLSFAAPLTGTYQADFPLTGLAEGLHTLTVGLPGAGVQDVSFEVDHTPPTATLNTLPGNFPGLSIPLSGMGGDDGSGVDYYEIQYAVGTTATWTTWTTVTASTEEYPALDITAFGPYAPVQVQYNQWYYFRVRAVDRAGNVGAFSPADYIETYPLPNPAVDRSQAIARVVELTNQVRAAQNPPLPPLKLNALLNASAWEHSDDTAYNGLSGHTGSDGSSPEDRIYRNGYDYLYAGENWAAGQLTPAAVVNAWVGSPAHFAVMTNPLFREIGLGYTFDPLDTNNAHHYWVQNFGVRQDIYPVVINGEAQTTTQSTVSLYIYGQGWAQDMRIGNDPAFTGASWQPYTSTVTWNLASGPGERTVYVQLRKSVTETQTVSDTIFVGGAPPRGVDLRITKMAAPSPVQAGDLLTYTLLVSSLGVDDATGVQVFDTLPAGLAVQYADASDGYCVETAGTVNCSLNDVAAGESVTITLAVLPSPSAIGVLSNTAVVFSNENDLDPSNNSASVHTTVKGGRADLALSVSSAPEPAYLGAITYTIRLENRGPSTALNPVLTDTLPAGIAFGGVQTASGVTCSHSGGVVSCGAATLAAGSALTVSIAASPAAAGVYTNTARAALDGSQFDPQPANNTAVAVTTVASAFVVTSAGDGGDSDLTDGACNDGSGNCTLRAAIQQANAAAGLDVIAFNIPGGGVHTIQPASPLPPISDMVFLDAASQPGYVGTPLIELDGSLAGVSADGLVLYAGASTVRGLAINRFARYGIYLVGADGSTISANFIGTDPSGTLDYGNGDAGLYLAFSSNTLIGGSASGEGNLISGNAGDGVVLSLSHRNQVVGNFIGTNISGTAAIANDFSGILVTNGMTNTIRNNLISGNAWRGVYLFDSGTRNNQVAANFIGTNAQGTGALPNAAFGIQLQDAAYTLIGGPNPGDGNLISGNGASGIMMGDPVNFLTTLDVGHVVQGNKIGTDVTGSAALPNGDQGIRIGSHVPGSFYRIGGTGIRIVDNLISGNMDNGLLIVGYTVVVQGNTIGADITGNAYLGNAGDGIYIGPVDDAVVRDNLISGNGGSGIYIEADYWTSNNHTIQGNIIGANAAGTATLGNAVYGIEVNGRNTLIGGPAPGDGNLISRNGNHGILLERGDNTVQGNIIGLTADGQSPLGNLGDGINSFLQDSQTIRDNLIGANINGIYLGGSSTVENNIIGTDATGTRNLGNIKSGIDNGYSSNNIIRNNTIAFNGFNGVLITFGLGNTISGNVVYSNTLLGIDLENDSVTVNDPGDVDTGGNNRQNYPVLTFAAAGNSAVIVRGTLSSAASTTYRLEFFASPQCDASGYGEGRDYLGFLSVTTNSSGEASFAVTLPTGSTVGFAVTATATDPGGNTSEFSPCASLALSADVTVGARLSSPWTYRGSPVTYTLSVTNSGPSNASGVTLTDSLPLGVTLGSVSASQGSCGQAGGALACSLGVLNVGGSAQVTLVLTPSVSGNLTSHIQVAASEPDPAPANNGMDIVLAADPADLKLTHTAAAEPAFSGAPLTYTLTVTNSGPMAAAGVTLTDTLPSGMHFVSVSASQGTCSQNGGVVVCALGGLPDAGSASASIVVSPTLPGVFTSTAVVRSNQGDPHLADNTASIGSTVDPADLMLTQSDLSDPATANRLLSYQVVLKNNGPAAATQVALTDNLPAGATFGRVSSSAGLLCSYAGGVVTCAVASLTAGASLTATISITPTVTGRITNTVSVVQRNPDPQPANDSASESTAILGGVDLRVSRSPNSGPALYMQPFTYTVVVSNAGALLASRVALTKELSTNVAFVSVSAAQGSCTYLPTFGGGTVSCSLGSLSPGRGVTVTTVVSPTSWGPGLDTRMVTTATVRSAQADASPEDNQALLVDLLYQSGDERWDPRFALPGTDAYVYVQAAGADGSLYIGGTFSSVGGVLANQLARWDGSQWHPVGGGLDPSPTALLVSGGKLYVGASSASFYDDTPGVHPAFTSGIAFWDGSRWNAMGGGIKGSVEALAEGPNGEIYVGGNFTAAGNISALGIAVWDGSAWASLGSGVTMSGSLGTVYSIAVDPLNGDVYIAGVFNTVDGVHANGVARWDGSQWHPLGAGVNGSVKRLLVQDNRVYIAGGLWSASGAFPSTALVVWDGSTWSSMLSGLTYGNGWSGSLYDAAFLNGDLYVVGAFDAITDTQGLSARANNAARWDGSRWYPLGEGVGSWPLTMTPAADDSRMFVGGMFFTAGTVGASRVAQWDGNAWSALTAQGDGQGLSDEPYAAAPAPNGGMYVGGQFETAGGTIVNGIGLWDGSRWQPLGDGISTWTTTLPRMAYALEVAPNGNLYIGGNLTAMGAVSARYIARWDGSQWHPLGNGVSSLVRAIAIDPASGDVYAGGDFWKAGGVNANGIARWDGTQWHSLGSGVNGIVYALAIHPVTGDLYAGGEFSSAGGITNTSGIARWDGTQWYPVGGSTGYVYALAFDPAGTLYAAGRFTTIGGAAANNIARWDGIQWHPLGRGLTGGYPYTEVRSLAVHGADVYAAGNIHYAGSLTSNGVARWDGAQWRLLGGGITNPNLGGFSGDGNVVAVGETGVYVGGIFIRAGHKPSNQFGLWRFPAPDLSIVQRDAPDPVLTGGVLTYTLTLSNNGLQDASGVVLTDTLPAGASFLSAAASQGSCAPAGGAVLCSLGALPLARSVVVSIAVQPSGSGALTNTVEAASAQSDLNPVDNRSVEITLINPADLSVQQAASPSPAMATRLLTYTLTVRNHGPQAASGIVLTDVLPGSAVFTAASASQGAGCAAPSGGLLTCSLGGLSAGASAQVTVVLTAALPGVLTNTVSVASASFDPNPGNNRSLGSTPVSPFLASFDGGIPPGWQVVDGGDGIGGTATWTSRNPCQRKGGAPLGSPWLMVDSDCAGPGDTQDEQLISPPIDASLCTSVQLSFASQFRSLALEIGDVDVSVDGGGTWVNALRLQGFDDGYPVPVTKTLDISALTAGNTFQVRFYYRNAHFDWWWAVDNFAITCSQQAPQLPALALTQSDSADPVTVGQAMHYQLVVTNSGAYSATGVTISDTLPLSATFGQAVASQGSCSLLGGRQLSCPVGAVPPGGSVQVTVVLTPTAAGLITNRASVSASQLEQVSSDNTAAESTTILPESNGQVQFSHSAYTASESGGAVVITVTRTGGSRGAVTVDYAASDGTARTGSDYTVASGVLTFADGETSQTFTVTVLDDALVEADETFTLTLSNPGGGAVLGSPVTALFTILDDDSAGQVQFSHSAYTGEEGGAVVITVTRTGGSRGAVTVDYATSEGSAIAGSDYTAASGTLTFADGETSQTFSVALLDDAQHEADETLTLTLGNPGGGAVLGSPVTAVLTIRNRTATQSLYLPLIMR